MVETFQKANACVVSLSNKLHGELLYHLICANCGFVVRSYVKEPQILLKKKDRN